MAKLGDYKGIKQGTGLRVLNSSETDAEIVIYASIGTDFWGMGTSISAKDISEELKKIPDTVKNLSIRINSEGGDVFDGVAIYNRLKQFKAKKTVHIDGLAASIASIIALAGDEILMGEGALFMIHLPWTYARGDEVELAQVIDRLRDVKDQMVSIYARKTKLSRAEIERLLKKETWMDYEEAKDLGFVTGKSEDTVAIAAKALSAPWITRPPQKVFSQTAAISSRLEKLKAEVDSFIARE